jgi:hypothetical protein
LRFFTLFIKKIFRYHETVQEEGAKRLELLAPLSYIPAPELIPFRFETGPQAQDGAGEEFFFCFDINETQGQSIEPDPAAFLGPLIAAGSAPPSPAYPGGLELPRGRYLFAQERAALGREEVIQMAVEIQKDGLWERLRLENRLYVRYLYEDGEPVTQIFRPYSD